MLHGAVTAAAMCVRVIYRAQEARTGGTPSRNPAALARITSLARTAELTTVTPEHVRRTPACRGDGARGA